METGGNVVGALAIFSYGFDKGRAAFETTNCSFDTLSNYDVLLEAAIASNYIKAEEVELLQSWRENPSAFGE